jgi:YgiT-type zinc finger domain-containing protein
MTHGTLDEPLEIQEVTYILELGEEIIIIEHVPARVNAETGERLFAPETVEKIQGIVRSRQVPKKVRYTPVFDFAA